MNRFLPYCLFLLVCTGCANGKKLQDDPPFKVESAYYHFSEGGVRGASSSITLIIPIEGLNPEHTSLDSVYFRGMKTALHAEREQPGHFIAHLKLPAKQQDLIFSADPKEEYGNKPPQKRIRDPFDLTRDQAVIQYTHRGRIQYVKIKGIQESPTKEIEIKNPQNIQH